MMAGEKLGVGHEPRHGEAYVRSWVQALRNDSEEIRAAAADAQRISGWVVTRERDRGPGADGAGAPRRGGRHRRRRRSAMLPPRRRAGAAGGPAGAGPRRGRLRLPGRLRWGGPAAAGRTRSTACGASCRAAPAGS